VTLDHKLGAFERFSLQVVNVDSAIGVFLRHLGSVLPGEEILGTLIWAHGRVQGTELKAVEFAIDIGWSFFLVFALARETSVNSGRKLAKIVVAVNLNIVRLVGCLCRRQTETNALIWAPQKSLETFLGRLFPNVLSNGSTCVGVDDAQIVIVWVVHVVLFAHDNTRVGGRIPKTIDILLGDK